MARENAGYHHTPTPMRQRDIDAWVVRLRCFLGRSRKKMRPIGKKAATRPLQSAQAQDAEERLLENQMRTWLSGLEQRLASAERWNGLSPAVVITTTPVGMRACEKIAGDQEFATLFDSCCYLTEYEYRYWCKEDTDLKFRFHINYWAWIKTSVPSARTHEFHTYPIAEGSKYWLLRHGVTGLGEHDYADCQVFEWDGTTTRLLAEHFREGVPSV